MEFQLWLKHNARSWLSPEGKFFPIWGVVTHLSWAMKHTNIGTIEAIDRLWKDKWQQVHFSERTLYTQNEWYQPNFKQKDALIDLALTEDVDQLIYLNNEKELKLWDKDDQI